MIRSRSPAGSRPCAATCSATSRTGATRRGRCPSRSSRCGRSSSASVDVGHRGPGEVRLDQHDVRAACTRGPRAQRVGIEGPHGRRVKHGQSSPATASTPLQHRPDGYHYPAARCAPAGSGPVRTAAARGWSARSAAGKPDSSRRRRRGAAAVRPRRGGQGHARSSRRACRAARRLRGLVGTTPVDMS